MSLYGLLSTGVSAMSAQTALLSTVSDNIANSSTIGYKDASAEFSTLVLGGGTSDYQSGGVEAQTTLAISGQGTITSTSDPTNLAVQGTGFFIVEGSNGQPVLTRNGSFEKDANGNLVNSAGLKLLGYPAGTTGATNGYAGLVPVNIGTLSLKGTPTTSGQLYLNLPSNSTAVTANLPSANGAGATYTDKTSLVTYDSLGNQVTLDIYLTNLGGNNWEVDAFNAADAATTNGPFPYGGSGLLSSTTLNFDSTTGALTSTSPTSISLTVPNGSKMTIDMSQTTQLAANYTILTASANGNAPSTVSSVNVGADGTLSATYQNGSIVPVYSIPLANVASPDNMTLVSGTAYQPNLQSGAAEIGKPQAGGFGAIQSSALENSTVDLASELATMIEAQNNYQADSKVFQTGSQLLSILINLKQ